jgi:hypothetical protein
MVDLQFPNFANALALGASARTANIRAEREQEEVNALRRRNSLGPDVQAAIGGDNGALGRIAAVDPDYAVKIGPILDKLDTNRQAVLKRAAEFTTQVGMGVLNAPPDQQAAAYAAGMQEAKRQGHDTTNWPQQWNPQARAWVEFNVHKALPVSKWFEEREKTAREGITLSGPMGGGAAPAGWQTAAVPQSAMPSGQRMVQTLTEQGLSPVAAAGIVGSLYQESGFNPKAVGDNGTAYGMGQWRNDRAAGLGQFAQQQGKAPTDPDVQLAFLVHEMKGGDMGAQRAWQMLQTAKTPEEATTAMMHFFRPQGYTPNNPQAGHGYAQRVQYAQSFMQPGGGGGAVPSAPGPVAMPPPPVSMAPASGMPSAQMPTYTTLPSFDGAGLPHQPQTSPASNAGPLPSAPPQADSNAVRAAPVGQRPPEYQGIKLPRGGQFVLKGGVPIIKDGTALIVRPDGGGGMTWDAVPLPQRKEPSNQPIGGPFAGTSMQAQALNILKVGDPSSVEYAMAFAFLSKPQTSVDAEGRPVVIQPMDLHMVRPPTLGAGPASTPAPGQPGSLTAAIPGGGSVTVMPSLAPKGPSASEMAKYRDAKAEGQTIIGALEDFRSEYKKATDQGGRLKSMSGANTPLNTAFSNAALLAKGEALYNLGVLNGPDLDIIRRTLPDPSSWRSALTSEADMNTAIDKVISLIRSRITEKEKALGLAPSQSTQSRAADLKKKYGLE